jgi:VWFA-related protein
MLALAGEGRAAQRPAAPGDTAAADTAAVAGVTASDTTAVADTTAADTTAVADSLAAVVVGAPGLVIQRIDLRGLPLVDARFTVRDGRGAWVTGLAPSDLAFTLDGKPLDPSGPGARLSSRLANDEHLTVAFAVDVSGSMRETLPIVRAAIADFVSRLAERDEVGLVTFSEAFAVPVPPGGDRARVVATLDSLAIQGNTALYDAIAGALDVLAESPNPRRALVAISDGADNRSRVALEDVRARAESAGVPIYAFALGPAADTTAMGELADATGGRLVPTTDPADLRALYAELVGLLAAEYRLELRLPGGADGAWHRLAIEVRAPLEGLAPGASRAERPFLATTGPGVARGFVAGARAAHARAGLARSWALASAAAFVLLALVVVPAGRARGRPLAPLVLLALVLALALGGFAAFLWTWLGSGV